MPTEEESTPGRYCVGPALPLTELAESQGAGCQSMRARWLGQWSCLLGWQSSGEPGPLDGDFRRAAGGSRRRDLKPLLFWPELPF